MTTEAERKFVDDVMRAHAAEVLLSTVPRTRPEPYTIEFTKTVMTLLCIRKMCQAPMYVEKMDAERKKILTIAEMFLYSLSIDTSEERFIAAIKDTAIELGLQQQSPWRTQS